MKQIRKLVTEVHRRSLWQVLGVYALASWIIYQVVLALWEGIGLPSWVPGTALVLLLIGLPIVLATAFVQEGVPGLRGEDGPRTVEGLETTADTLTPRRDAGEEEAAPTAQAIGGGAASSPSRTTTENARGGTLFTWSKAVTGGVLAFAALGLATTGFMGMRALGIGPAATLVSSGVLEERAPVVLADFESLTGDESLARVVTEAFRADLAQSRIIKLANPGDVAYVLERMEREGGGPLRQELAREVATRGGMKAVIAGDIGELRGRYVLTARVISAMEGEVLLTLRETASDSTEIIPAIDRLAKSTRERIGESLRSVRRSPYLMAITTPSLPALKKLVQAHDAANRGDDDRALVLLDEAIELDPEFSEAYRKKGAILNNQGRASEAIEALNRALAHPERLTDYERYHTRGLLASATGQRPQAIVEYRALVELNPEDSRALNNLAVQYVYEGDWERAERTYARAVEVLEALQPGQTVFPYTYTNLAVARWNLGRRDSIEAVLQKLEDIHPDHPVAAAARTDFLAAEGDYEAALGEAAALLQSQPGSLEWQQWAHNMQAEILAARGQIARAVEQLTESVEVGQARDVPVVALRHGLRIALVQALVLGDTAAARATLREHRRRFDLDSLADAPLQPLTAAYAAAGQLDSARAILDRVRALPERALRWDPTLLLSSEAAVAMAEGDYARAADLYTRAVAEPFGCDICYLPQLGLARELQGDDEAAAIEAYERFLDTDFAWRMNWHWTADGDGLYRPFVHERLAGLHERRGDTARAAEHYRAFIELWQDADPALQPRVEAARRALARLSREGRG